LSLINKVLFVTKVEKEDGKSYNRYRIDKHAFLEEKQTDYNSENAYPIINRDLATYLGFDDDEEDEAENQDKYKRIQNRYTRYYDKINNFYKRYLDNDGFVPKSQFLKRVLPMLTLCRLVIHNRKAKNWYLDMFQKQIERLTFILRKVSIRVLLKPLNIQIFS
jgi:hypothetical protein